MGRKNLIRDPYALYHLTSRCNNREWFGLPLPQVWEIFEERLVDFSKRHSILPHLFVLMSNHFHLLVSDPDLRLDIFMRELMTNVSKEVARQCQRINHVFGGRYKWSVVYRSPEASMVYKYICRNPVRVGLCERVEDYPFSTLGFVSRIPIVERTDEIWRFGRVPLAERLAWLNRPTPVEQEKMIGLGLRRFEFQLSTSNAFRKQVSRIHSEYASDRG